MVTGAKLLLYPNPVPARWLYTVFPVSKSSAVKYQASVVSFRFGFVYVYTSPAASASLGTTEGARTGLLHTEWQPRPSRSRSTRSTPGLVTPPFMVEAGPV